MMGWWFSHAKTFQGQFYNLEIIQNFETEASLLFFENLLVMKLTMWLCCCLLVLLMTEHTSKGKSKSEMFSFYTGEKRNKKKKNNKTKQPQIHCYAICLNLVWTACTAHNLSVITHSSELEREQEDKYNSAIYSLILKKITLL